MVNISLFFLHIFLFALCTFSWKKKHNFLFNFFIDDRFVWLLIFLLLLRLFCRFKWLCVCVRVCSLLSWQFFDLLDLMKKIAKNVKVAQRRDLHCLAVCCVCVCVRQHTFVGRKVLKKEEKNEHFILLSFFFSS